MKKVLKWIAIFGASIVVLFVAALVYAIAGPRPPIVEGTERPSWLPEVATNVYYRSQEGFGWWKAAEFTISEEEFRAYAAKQGWTVSEEQNFSRVQFLQLLRAEGTPISDDDLTPIPRALIYQRRASNNGGVTAALDLSTNRAYYTASHR